MKKTQNQFDRRTALKALGLGSAAGALGISSKAIAQNDQYEKGYTASGMDPVKITKVRPILTAPYGINLVIVKVETDQPGLYGRPSLSGPTPLWQQ